MAIDAPGMRGFRSRNEHGQLRDKRDDTHMGTIERQYGRKFARQESFLTPERVKEYYARVSEAKQMKIYDAPHALNAEARRDRAAFLQKQLRLSAIDMTMLAKVPELIQPPEPNR